MDGSNIAIKQDRGYELLQASIWVFEDLPPVSMSQNWISRYDYMIG